MHRCTHPIYGLGRLTTVESGKATVTFDNGRVEKLATDSMAWLPELGSESYLPDAPQRAVVRAQSVAIQSVQTRWGVFSPSRVRGLPHQLWVCQRVLADWPRSWLIADDVGLGKTIEAGLILSALLAAGTVKRLIVICPASLVDQWRERLREMFDIRATLFSSDTEKSKTFWNDNHHVVASLHRLRLDNPGKTEVTRWERLLEAKPWDVIIVDEAHHLNADEQTGETLGLRLLKRMQLERKIKSLLLFTGTPHRGKYHGFASLLGLIDPHITPRTPWSNLQERLPQLMIRNNKQQCTDLNGQRLFQPVSVKTQTFQFSQAERRFYSALAEFIRLGFAFSSRLDPHVRRHCNLVLIALLKLATSSTEAVKRAIQGRIKRLNEVGSVRRPEAFLDGDGLEEWTDPEGEAAAIDANSFSLFQDAGAEISQLRRLLILADAVATEVRIEQALAIARGLAPKETLLMFTEYKATQALLVSQLGEVFDPKCVAFINGDERLIGVKHGHGPDGVLEMDRNTAAYGFNRGAFRFLVSTEAAGEGIDLHERCARLVHVDMPWNPMRMHQRVGRLNRIGQTHEVHVTVLRNDDSLEGVILGKLYEKLDAIQSTFNAAMADPEDIRGLVLGGVTPRTNLLSEAFERWSNAAENRPQIFDHWLKGELKTLEGDDNAIVELVGGLIGDVTRFDFEKHGRSIPKLDLTGLKPFIENAAHTAGAHVESAEQGGLRLLIPDGWRNNQFAHFTVVTERRMQWFVFDRNQNEPPPSGVNRRLAGPGDRLFDAVLAWTECLSDQVAVVDGLVHELVVFVCVRSQSEPSAVVQRVLVGAERMIKDDWNTLQDWEVLDRLNKLPQRLKAPRVDLRTAPIDPNVIAAAQKAVELNLDALGVSFKAPVVLPFALFIPKELEKCAEMK